jgi:hypothetical protein
VIGGILQETAAIIDDNMNARIAVGFIRVELSAKLLDRRINLYRRDRIDTIRQGDRGVRSGSEYQSVNDRTGKEDIKDISPLTTRPTSTRLTLLAAVQASLLVVLVIYFCLQGAAYLQASPRYTFQGTDCISPNPTDQSPIINYMQHAHIYTTRLFNKKLADYGQQVVW